MASKEKDASSSLVELDPLFKDLTEKKQSFRKNVVSLAAELKDVRNRLASQEESFIRESQSRKVAELKAKSPEEEVGKLQICLEDRRKQLEASSSSREQATAEASAASAESAQSQCLSLLRELDEKNTSLKENEIRVTKLGEQLDYLQKDLQTRELSQKQLKDEVLRMEKEIMHIVTKAGANKDCELRKMLDEVSPRNFDKMNKFLDEKDDEIAQLRDEMRFLSTHWKHKTKELESQAGERRDRALKELRDQVAMKEQNEDCIHNKPNFWESSGFKAIVSLSMLILVAFSRR